MGRHSLPDDETTDAGRSRPRVRRRTVPIATMLVVAVAAGAQVAARRGRISRLKELTDPKRPVPLIAIAGGPAPADRTSTRSPDRQGGGRRWPAAGVPGERPRRDPSGPWSSR
ncbi:hypothetical protein ACWDZ6_27255 [Streptomyces sp. NPDC002926]